jgi:hypothetical protein
MALYGLLVNGPLGHVLYTGLALSTAKLTGVTATAVQVRSVSFCVLHLIAPTPRRRVSDLCGSCWLATA